MTTTPCKKREAFFKADFKAREESGEKLIEGYFIVYDSLTRLWDGFHEKIARGACTKAIHKNDIRALYNHDHDVVLGRTRAKTLTLTEDDYGVRGTVVINPNDTEALNIYERVKRGDITGCSFGFYPTREEYANGDGGSVLCTVTEAEVIEISVCPFPAYPQTAIEARKQGFTEQKNRALEAKRVLLKERLDNVFSRTAN